MPSAKRRLHFCGALNGSILMRPDETERQALDRAQEAILNCVERHARSLGPPNIGLEFDEVENSQARHAAIHGEV